MDVFRNGKLIGYSNYFFTHGKNTLEVKNYTKFKLKLLKLVIFSISGESLEKYKDGSFKNYMRWDDAWMFTAAVEENPSIESKDIASKTSSSGHVVKDGELSGYLAHFKGIHWRKYGVDF